jgi:hypothetical protein
MHRLIGRLPAAMIGLAGLATIVFGMLAASATSLVVAAGTTWTIQSTPNRSTDFNQLSAIAANTASDVWAVGTFRGPSSNAFRTLIEHFDGTKWRAIKSPNKGTLSNGLNGVSADSSTDAWAVGSREGRAAERTLTERWNGIKWSVVASPNVGSSSNALRGVSAISPTDAWAVGAVGFTSATLAEHWDGTSWTVQHTPSLPGGGAFWSVAAVSSSDAWAVGALGDGDDGTLAEHWNGTSWSIVSTPDIAGDARFNSVTAISSSDVWAVGSQGGRTLTEHWNGISWSIMPSPSPVPWTRGTNFLAGVTAVSTNDVWAVGRTLDFTLGSLEQTLILHWDGAAWTEVASPNQGRGSNRLLGTDSAGGGVVFATGSFQGSSGTSRTLVLRTTNG